MNYEVLQEAEASFLQMYPKGFSDPALETIRKKHNVDRLIEFTQENLTQSACNKPHFIADTLLKIVSRSSMVSRFEKPPFRQFIDSLGTDDREALAFAVEQRLFGRKQKGFETIVGMLSHHKLAKWAVVSADYCRPGNRRSPVQTITHLGVLQRLQTAADRCQKTDRSIAGTEQCRSQWVSDDKRSVSLISGLTRQTLNPSAGSVAVSTTQTVFIFSLFHLPLLSKRDPDKETFYVFFARFFGAL